MSNLERIFEQYIRGTEKQALVKEITIKLCTLTNEVQRVCGFDTATVLVSTRVIKKNYDKRPAEEHDFILRHGWKVITLPDHIYVNKTSKRGDYRFGRTMRGGTYVASIEIDNSTEEQMLLVASLFRIGKSSYLNSYELYWSWKDGEPSS